LRSKAHGFVKNCQSGESGLMIYNNHTNRTGVEHKFCKQYADRLEAYCYPAWPWPWVAITANESRTSVAAHVENGLSSVMRNRKFLCVLCWRDMFMCLPPAGKLLVWYASVSRFENNFSSDTGFRWRKSVFKHRVHIPTSFRDSHSM